MAEKLNGEAVVTVSQLSKSFGKNQVLRGVDISLHKTENLVVLGKSGTGKSVLIKCIVNLIYPDKGKIIALGTDITNAGSKSLNQVRKKIGFLFQNAALYDSMTVRENLEFPLVRHIRKLKKSEINQRIMEALQNVGLEESVDKMPSELSGGMKKRIGLARTLILEPEVILYDEPTTGLDPITSAEIGELIMTVREKFKTSSIIITHDMNFAEKVSHRIVMLKEGKIYREGTYSELQQSDDPFINSFFYNQ